MLYPSDFGINPMYPDARDFSVIEVNNEIGKGVITHRSFKTGDMLAHISGVIVKEVMQHSLEINEELHNYDPFFSGYFLHSCEPNIHVDMQGMYVTALKNIRADSLLYMDYSSTESRLFKQFSCHCGSKSCRKWIQGNKEMITEYITLDYHVE